MKRSSGDQHGIFPRKRIVIDDDDEEFSADDASKKDRGVIVLRSLGFEVKKAGSQYFLRKESEESKVLFDYKKLPASALNLDLTKYAEKLRGCSAEDMSSLLRLLYNHKTLMAKKGLYLKLEKIDKIQEDFFGEHEISVLNSLGYEVVGTDNRRTRTVARITDKSDFAHIEAGHITTLEHLPKFKFYQQAHFLEISSATELAKEAWDFYNHYRNFQNAQRRSDITTEDFDTPKVSEKMTPKDFFTRLGILLEGSGPSKCHIAKGGESEEILRACLLFIKLIDESVMEDLAKVSIQDIKSLLVEIRKQHRRKDIGDDFILNKSNLGTFLDKSTTPVQPMNIIPELIEMGFKMEKMDQAHYHLKKGLDSFSLNRQNLYLTIEDLNKKKPKEEYREYSPKQMAKFLVETFNEKRRAKNSEATKKKSEGLSEASASTVSQVENLDIGYISDHLPGDISEDLLDISAYKGGCSAGSSALSNPSAVVAKASGICGIKKGAWL